MYICDCYSILQVLVKRSTRKVLEELKVMMVEKRNFTVRYTWVSNMFLCKMFVLEVFIFIYHVSAIQNGVNFLFHTGQKV